ncbi:antitoxin Xre/MbcA/ParS toxin-binding domain-containing protein [Microbacterium sp.]|uniref:antitoxin Xre/MbcA/ParS toxin-binding domain-containing protein n=1 Tax=Microbacterium sp. TaxID=51671 RepID=UPI002FE3FE73
MDLEIANRANVVAKVLGSRAKLANILKVSTSQPTRWIKGQESPNSENTRAIVDLEHVVIRARLLWGDDEVVNAWLTGRNGFLDGARPIDVIATQGSGPAIDALDQATAGAFA